MLLPFPPSLNAYYRNVNGRTLISAEGRAYRNAILACPDVWKAARWPEDQRLAVTVTVFPPDRRRRDLDNTCKADFCRLKRAIILISKCPSGWSRPLERGPL